MATLDLFDALDEADPAVETLADGAVLLRAFARPMQHALLAELGVLITAAPLRHLVTPGGARMSVAMTNCGPLGWVSDRRGYRYAEHDPETGLPWPAMPETFRALALRSAARAGFEAYAPDACLINRYAPGTRLTLHQDRDERHLGAPIVSVSLGLPATYLLGGLNRNDKTLRVSLRHGDVLVLGGASRMRFHGVLPVADGAHALLGAQRINLTFRRAA